jgi:hypothetical protein
MSTTTNKAIYAYRINDFASPSGWATSNLFDTSFIEPNQSPIDTFYEKLMELNRLILDPRNVKQYANNIKNTGVINQLTYDGFEGFINNTSTISGVHANLILLGYISAVESYFREIIRKIISIDEIARKSCESKAIAFGAALFHQKAMLPEALLESISFINRENIKDVLKQFIGITGIPFSSSVDEALFEFENVCQLRHCIVHRFGKLGANNAIKLGLDAHGGFIEKPIKIDYAGLQNVAHVSTNICKEINQFLWQIVMMRQIAEPTNQTSWRKKSTSVNWLWDFRKDKKKFKLYFDTFASTRGGISISLRDAYNEYRNKFNNLPL